MVIQCDHCQAKFKLDDSKVGPKGVKVRCTKCKEVFVVKPPAPSEEAPATPVSTAPVPTAAPPAPTAPAPTAAAPAAPPAEAGGGFDFGSPPEPEAAQAEAAPAETPQAGTPPQEEEEVGGGFDFGSPPDVAAPAAPAPAPEPPKEPAPAEAAQAEKPAFGGGGEEFELDTGREEGGGMDSFDTGDTGDAFGGFDFGGGQEEAEEPQAAPAVGTESAPGLESSFDYGGAAAESADLGGQAPELSVGGEEEPTAPQEDAGLKIGGGALDEFSFGGEAGEAPSAEAPPAEKEEEAGGGFSFDFDAGGEAAAEEEKPADAGGETIVFSIDDTMSGGEQPKPKEEEPTEEGKSVLAGFDEPLAAEEEAPVFTADAASAEGGEAIGADFGSELGLGEGEEIDTGGSISAMAEEEAGAEKKPKKKFKAPSISAGLKKALAAMLIIAVLGGGGFYAYTTGIVDTIVASIPGGAGGAGTAADNIEISNLEVKFINNKNLGYIMAIKCNITNLTDSNQSVSAIKGIIYGESNRVLGTRLVSSGRILSDLQLKDFTEIEIKKTFRDTESNPLAPRGKVPVMVVFTDITADIVKAEIEILQ